MASSRWRKVKLSLGLNCLNDVPRTLDEVSSSAVLVSQVESEPSNFSDQISKSGSDCNSSKKICAICLSNMNQGQALFTAECSHTFHFKCISSNIKYGYRFCPICRIKWTELPLISPKEICKNTPKSSQIPIQHHRIPSLIQDLDPCLFNDDEPLEINLNNINLSPCIESQKPEIEIKTFTELSEIQKSEFKDNFMVLIHLKAPNFRINKDLRAPIDLITVLDTSGSMVGTKLTLLKQAMSFVIQNLSKNDRLCVISFSNIARRLFPLSKMNNLGREKCKREINLLKANGGTNIVEGLKKGVKVIEERREKNPVCCIILLSDGQDTYTVTPTTNIGNFNNPETINSLLPSAARSKSIPVHVFGFGTDHDSLSLHSISEQSGGTFSFVETEISIQDAFAQCIGGLLSVFAQKLKVNLEVSNPESEVKFGCIKSGNYGNFISQGNKIGEINVGDLYAEEERDFLVSINVPPEESLLFNVGCEYINPTTNQIVNVDKVDVKILRPLHVALDNDSVLSIEVDRQKNRVVATEAMEKTRFAAESGDFPKAISILEQCRRNISESAAGKSGDQLSAMLDAELRQMQERMTDRKKYEDSGRAYMLSGLSSHSWQRATSRGDSSSSYQTSSMVAMLQRSQTISINDNKGSNNNSDNNNNNVKKMRQVKSFPARPEPR